MSMMGCHQCHSHKLIDLYCALYNNNNNKEDAPEGISFQMRVASALYLHSESSFHSRRSTQGSFDLYII